MQEQFVQSQYSGCSMPGLKLSFPKMITLLNPRLTMLYWFWQLLFLSLIICWLVLAHPWEETVDLTRISSHMRVLPASTTGVEERIQNLSRDRQVTRLCTGGGFNDTASSSHGCVVPCTRGLLNNECWQLDETYKEADAEVFLATHVHETLAAPGEHPLEQDYVVPFTEGFAIGLTYFYELSQFSWSGSWQSMATHWTRIEESSMRNIKTVLLDKNGKERRAVEPGAEIQFTLQEVLEMAGQSSQLEMPNSLIQQQPRNRFSGMELLLNAECFPDSERPTCFLSARRTIRGWTWWQEKDVMSTDGKRRVRRLHGIRLKFEPEGRFSRFSFNKLVGIFTSVLVLMKMPRYVMMFICTFALGQLSKIYQEVLYEDFSLYNFVGGLAMRLLVANTAFVTLMDCQLQGGGHAISKARLNERLKEILPSGSLDHDEIKTITDFCVSTANNKATTCAFRNTVSEMQRLRRSKSLALENAIDSQAFTSAVTSNERVSFETVVCLLDSDRRRRILERIFTPSYFQKFAQKSKASNAKAHEVGGVGGLSETKVADNNEEVLQGCSKGSKFSHWSLSLEEKLEKQESAINRLLNLQHEVNALKEAEQKLRVSVGDIGLLQRDVENLTKSHHVGFEATTEAVSELLKNLRCVQQQQHHVQLQQRQHQWQSQCHHHQLTQDEEQRWPKPQQPQLPTQARQADPELWQGLAQGQQHRHHHQHLQDERQQSQRQQRPQLTKQLQQQPKPDLQQRRQSHTAAPRVLLHR